jgi:hypothetical protein
MNKVVILYSGIDAFYPQTTPFVAVESTPIYYNGFWANTERVTLEGMITGCTYGSIITGQKTLSATFSQSFQPLTIWQIIDTNSGKMFEKDYAKVDSITYPSSRWYGGLPYSISLTCYPANTFSGSFGVLNPVDRWSFAEQNNVVVNATHTISCRGFNTSVQDNNALTNAMAWGTSRSGIPNYIQPLFISGAQSGNLSLRTIEENVDRFNATYALTENYVNDAARTGYGILRYSTNFESGNGRIAGVIDGTAQASNRDIVTARNIYSGLDKFAALSRQYQRMFNRTDLHPTILSQTVDENPYEALVSFSQTYDNLDLPDVYFDYTAALNSGDNIKMSIGGDIIVRGGDINSKLQNALNYKGQVDLYGLSVPYYANGYPYAAQFPLNPIPLSSGVSINRANGVVSLRAEFDNREIAPAPVQELYYTLTLNPSVQRLDSQPILDGQGVYSIVDLGYGNRASLNVNGNALIDTTGNLNAGIAIIQGKAQQWLNQYGRLSNVALESNSMTFDRTDKRKLSFNYTWTFDSANKVALYSNVLTLQV